jgi:hypothetical protein
MACRSGAALLISWEFATVIAGSKTGKRKKLLIGFIDVLVK